jgi:hypothetical protein
MIRPGIERLQQRRAALLERLSTFSNLMRGSVYEKLRKCGRPACACATGGAKHTTLQLTVFLRGKTHTRYVRQGELAQVQAWTANYHRLLEIVDELTEVNLELLRGSHPGGKPTRRRRA